MTDREKAIVELAAKRVMGWKKVKGYWNPLESLDDAWMLVEKVWEKYGDKKDNMRLVFTCAAVYEQPAQKVACAITLSALETVGVEWRCKDD